MATAPKPGSRSDQPVDRPEQRHIDAKGHADAARCHQRFVPWPTEDGPWQMVLSFTAVEDGPSVMTGLELRSHRDIGNGAAIPTHEDGFIAIGSEVLRKISVPAVEAEARAFLRSEVEREAESGGVTPGEARDFLADLAPAQRQRGGAPDYLEVAACYSAAWFAGSRPIRAVADRWSVSASTASTWVSRARNEHGYLEPTEPRKANGRLTDKATAELEARRGSD